MNNKRNLILGGLAVVVLILAALVIRELRQSEDPVGPGQMIIIEDEPEIDSGSAEPGPDGDPFREEAPAITRIPEANEVLPTEQQDVIAVPDLVTPAAPGVESNLRNFEVTAEGDRFVPEKVIVRLGDTVHIKFTAMDKDYDIVFPSNNMRAKVLQGQTKTMAFQAVQDGSFVYFCQNCGGADSSAKGNIIVIK